jgi:tetratricopeptide (TPR) repeat protein
LIDMLRSKDPQRFLEFMANQPASAHPAMKKIGHMFRTAADARRLMAAGRLAEAEAVTRDGIAAIRSAGGDPSLFAALDLLLANIYQLQGRHDAASQVLRATVDVARGAVGPGGPGTSPLFVRAANALGSSLLRQNRPAEAEAAFREVLDVLRRNNDPQSVMLVEPLVGIGSAEAGQGNYAAAEADLRQALAILDRQTPDAARRFEVMVLLGGVLADQHRLAEAEPLLRQGYARLATAGVKVGSNQLREGFAGDTAAPAQSRIRLDAARRLARLYEETGRPDEAARMWDDVWSLADTPPPWAVK